MTTLLSSLLAPSLPASQHPISKLVYLLIQLERDWVESETHELVFSLRSWPEQGPALELSR